MTKKKSDKHTVYKNSKTTKHNKKKMDGGGGGRQAGHRNSGGLHEGVVVDDPRSKLQKDDSVRRQLAELEKQNKQMQQQMQQMAQGGNKNVVNVSVADSADPEKNKRLVNGVSHRAFDPVSGQVDFKKLAARVTKLNNA